MIVEALNEVVGDPQAILRRSRLGIADAFFFVRVQLPFIQGVRFFDVDGDESDAVSVLAKESLNALDRAPEGGSGEAPENEDDRTAAEILSKACGGLPIEREKLYIWSRVADLKGAFLPLVVANHADDVARSDPSHDDRRRQST